MTFRTITLGIQVKSTFSIDYYNLHDVQQPYPLIRNDVHATVLEIGMQPCNELLHSVLKI